MTDINKLERLYRKLMTFTSDDKNCGLYLWRRSIAVCIFMLEKTHDICRKRSNDNFN